MSSNLNQLLPVLGLIVGSLITIFIAVLEVFILVFIWDGTWNKKNHRGINLEKLISESSGDASLARFQLMIFTFVISMSLVLIITSGQPPNFPSIPDQILGLLGISSSSYVLGKALQTQIKPPPPDSSAAPPPDPTNPDP